VGRKLNSEASLSHANNQDESNEIPILCRKKWLPQQLRKLSHSKTDKLPVDKSALKKGSDKKSKVSFGDCPLSFDTSTFDSQDKQKEEPESPAPTAVAPSLPGPSFTNSIHQHPEEVEDALECLELPPPMKPIQDASQIVGDDNCIQTTNPSNSKALDESDLAEIEQIVKEKMVSDFPPVSFELPLKRAAFFPTGKTRS
jgi:hypothetical protein